jgi:hypothetical protein
MTLDELIERLTALKEDGEATGEELVLFAHQPHWPLQCGIDGPVVVCEQDEEIDELNRQMWSATDPEEITECKNRLNELRAERVPIVYLNEGSSRPWHDGRELSPYAPRSAWGG